MDSRIMAMLREAKDAYAHEGLVILGVFGSRARGDNDPDSDLDVLYRLDDRFYQRYPGWEAVGRLNEIRLELESQLGLTIDMANADALHSVSRKHILPDTVYVP